MSKSIKPNKAQLASTDALFVYGTLAQGKLNEHILASVKGIAL